MVAGCGPGLMISSGGLAAKWRSMLSGASLFHYFHNVDPLVVGSQVVVLNRLAIARPRFHDASLGKHGKRSARPAALAGQGSAFAASCCNQDVKERIVFYGTVFLARWGRASGGNYRPGQPPGRWSLLSVIRRIVNERMGGQGPPCYVTPVHVKGFGGGGKIWRDFLLLPVGGDGCRGTAGQAGSGTRVMIEARRLSLAK
jgi:hypothetical protein